VHERQQIDYFYHEDHQESEEVCFAIFMFLVVIFGFGLSGLEL